MAIKIPIYKISACSIQIQKSLALCYCCYFLFNKGAFHFQFIFMALLKLHAINIRSFLPLASQSLSDFSWGEYLVLNNHTLLKKDVFHDQLE